MAKKAVERRRQPDVADRMVLLADQVSQAAATLHEMAEELRNEDKKGTDNERHE